MFPVACPCAAIPMGTILGAVATDAAARVAYMDAVGRDAVRRADSERGACVETPAYLTGYNNIYI